MYPTEKGGNKVLKCKKCGAIEKIDKKAKEKYNLEEKIHATGKTVVVSEEYDTKPKTRELCPKCGNKEAYYWFVQTRAEDESATKFYRCTKCGHTWREYD